MAKFKVLKECNVEGSVVAVDSIIEADAEIEKQLIADGYLEAVVEDVPPVENTPGESTGEEKVAAEENGEEQKSEEAVA